jgi:hypothetical protein
MPDMKIGITAQDKTQGAFKKVNKSVAGLKNAFGGLKAGIAGALGAVAVGAWVKNMMALGDRIGKVSQAIGIGTDSLQRLQFAAEQSGVSTENINKGLQKFSRTVGEANMGMKIQVEAFEAIGVSTTDVSGKTRGLESLFLDVAEALKIETDKTRKAKIASDLFGRSGVELIVMLEEGKEGLSILGDEVEAVGGIMTQQGIKDIQDFNDAMNKMSKVGRKVFTEVISFAFEFVETLKDLGLMEDVIFTKSGKVFKNLTDTKALRAIQMIEAELIVVDEDLKNINDKSLTWANAGREILRLLHIGEKKTDVLARLETKRSVLQDGFVKLQKHLNRGLVKLVEIQGEVPKVLRKSNIEGKKQVETTQKITVAWAKLFPNIEGMVSETYELTKAQIKQLDIDIQRIQHLERQKLLVENLKKEEQKIAEEISKSTDALKLQQLTGELNFKTTTKLVKEFSQYEDAITRGVKHNQTLTRETVKQTKQLVKQRKLSQEVPKALFEGIKGAGAGASRFFHAMGIQLKEVGNKMKLTFSTNWLAIITRFAMSSKKVQGATDKLFSTVGNAVDSLLPDIFSAKSASDEWAKRLAEIEERVGKYRTDINEISRSLKHITPEAQVLAKLEEEYAANKEEAQRLESVHLSYLADVNFELSNMKGNVDAMRSATISFTASIQTFLDAVATEGMTMMQKTVFSTLQGFEKNVLGTFNKAIGEAQKIIDSPDYKKNLSLSTLGDSLETIKNQFDLGGIKTSGQRDTAISAIAGNTEAMKLMTSGQQQLFKDLASGEKAFDLLGGADQRTVGDVINQMMDVGKETKGPLATQVKLLEEANATIANLTPQVELATTGLKVMIKGIVEGAVKEGKSREDITAELGGLFAQFNKAGLLQADINDIIDAAISGKRIGGGGGAGGALGGLFKVFQGGGMVRGRSHLAGGTNANLESGEFVMRKGAVDQYGAGFMDAVNKGQFGGVTVNIYDGTGKRLDEYDSYIRYEIQNRADRNGQFPALEAA